MHKPSVFTLGEHYIARWKLGIAFGVLTSAAWAHPQPEDAETAQPVTLETMEVQGRATDLIGIAGSASQGVVGQPEFKYRPFSRVGELVEVVPGTLATQHSGSGKANQFFLRGFNLDHGTDFNTTVDGIPMNLPSHAHGQGYLDLNGIIPELVDRVEFGKGPYYADAGDFSSAGYAHMHTMHRLGQGFVKFTGGEYDYYRGVAANSSKLGWGDFLYAAEVNFNQGPWTQPEQLQKYNGMLRYTIDEETWGASMSGKAYHSNWTATNQIPERAVPGLGIFGTMDPSDGGSSGRYSLSGNLWSKGDSYKNELTVYGSYYDLGLWSNFTGFLDDPLRGDQIAQKERRWIAGGSGEQTWYNHWFGLDMDNTLGFQVRHDSIRGLELSHTQNRQRLNRVSLHDIDETRFSFYLKNQTHWLEKFRTIAAVRSDTFEFDVTDRLTPQNSGDETATTVSPKLSLIFGPWYDTEFFINLGYGFHSNDARGATVRVDPADPSQPMSAVSPIAKQRGAEGGIRTQYVPGLNSTLAVWWLHSSSELVFLGDAGTTEPSGESERFGVEWTNYYKPVDWLTLDADFAFTSARYLKTARGFDNIPNSVGRVIGAGVVIELPYDLYATLRVRHFGHVNLIEDNTAYGGDTTLLNLGTGYKYKDFKLELDVFNLLDSRANDIAYFYTSRLQDEPAGGVNGIMKHVVMPRQVRVTASLQF